MSRILLLSNEKSTSNILNNLLRTEGYKIIWTGNQKRAEEIIKTEQFNLMISSVGGEWDTDLDLIKLASTEHPEMPVIAIIGDNGDNLLKGMEALNIFAMIEKPFKIDHLLTTVQKAVDYNDTALVDNNINLNLQLETCYRFEDIVAESPAMKAVCDMINRVATTDVTVLLEGEPDTGKELVAKTIHNNSNRNECEFVVADCRALNIEQQIFGDTDHKGALIRADGSTLFFQEISDLPLSTQDKLLDVLQERKINDQQVDSERKINIRVIAATSRNLEQMVSEGYFNQGLYNLLKIILIKVPPLRNRKEDVMPIVRQILQHILGDTTLLPRLDFDVIQLFEKYSWSGNLKEMESVLRYSVNAANDCGVIKEEYLPPVFIKK